jgi:hypothetical protein
MNADREEQSEGIGQDVALAAKHLLARIIAGRVERGPPCMRRNVKGAGAAWVRVSGSGARSCLSARRRRTLYPVGLVEPHHHPSCKVIEAQVDRTHL